MKFYHSKLLLVLLLSLVSMGRIFGQSRRDFLKLVSAGNVSPVITNKLVDTIPIEIVDGRIVLNVSIGSDVKRFIWDTGSAYSTISNLNAHFSSLEDINVKFNDNAGKNVGANLFRLDSMSIGNFFLQNMTFMKLDNRTAAEGSLKQYEGLLGLNVIDKLNWQFDFDQNRVMISEKAFPVDKEKTVRYANMIDHNFFRAKIKLPTGKSITLRIFIDFGVTNSSFFLDESNLAAFKNNSAVCWKGVSIGVGGTSDPYLLYQITDSFECTLGPKGKDITMPINVVVGSNTGRNVVGSSFFTKYNFTRNSINSTFTFYPRNSDTVKEVGRKQYGIDLFVKDEKDIVVVGLIKSNDPWRSKIDVGDKVRTINGQSSNEFNSTVELNNFINKLRKSETELILELFNGEILSVPLKVPEKFDI